MQAVLGEKLFWDSQEEIAKILFQDRHIVKEYIDDYGTEKYKTYEAAEDNTTLLISSNNHLTYSTNHSIYINHILFSDSRFDDYNGDKYQKKSDLDFMSQEEAWKTICMTLDRMGVEVSERYTCFVMDHVTMREEEQEAIARAKEEDSKIFAEKSQWTADDDCYYFKTNTSWEGYPVLPVMMGEGFDEENVSVIYGKNGIEFLYINGYYPLKENKEIFLRSPEEAVEKLRGYLENIISNDLYEIRKVTLCQKVMQMNPGNHTAEIVPAWECSVLVKSEDSSDSGYIQKIYFHAETLKEVI